MLYCEDGVNYLWHVWDADKEGGQWALVGGDVNRLEDKTLYGTAKREWMKKCSASVWQMLQTIQ